jgi:hypothetical protein
MKIEMANQPIRHQSFDTSSSNEQVAPQASSPHPF